MGRTVAVAVAGALIAALVLTSIVGASVRHTGEVPGSFLAVASSQESTGSRTVDLSVLDLNGDGFIDPNDLKAVVASLGSRIEDRLASDVNRDGVVDVLDLAIVGMSYGAAVDRGKL